MQTRTAALLLLLTAVGGRGLLSWRGADAGEGVALSGAPPAGTPGVQRARAAARTPEVGEGERIDVDRATAAELVRLPGVGPGMAQRIVAERARGGSFGGAPCLDARVAGIGEGFLRKAGPHLDFSGDPCPLGGGERGGGGGCPAVVDLDRAGRGELECLPGIGRARAESILAYRSREGGFGSVEELGRVPGVPRGVVEGLRERASAGRVP
jgi:competence ComEA-like helix-hairpin-helix protein